MLRQTGEPKQETRGILALVIARPVVLTVAVGLGMVFDRAAFGGGSEAAVGILGATCLITGIHLVLYALRLSRAFQLGFQILTDVLLLSALVIITGGPDSQYVLLYLILILYASMYSSFRGALAAGILSAGAYLASSLPQLVALHEVRRGGVAGEPGARMFLNGVLFMMVGILGGYLARSAEQREKKLRDATKELQSIRLGTDVIMESIGSGIISIDSEEKVVHFNRAASAILGLERGRILNRGLEETLGASMGDLTRLLRRGLEEGSTVTRGEMVVTLGDGRTIPLGINTSLVLTESGRRAGVIALCQDLTEPKKNEEKAKRQETLALLGQFSAGIAHEIRNCLSPIAGSVELLRKDLHLEGDSHRLMELILKQTDRLETFLTELLFYARTKPLETRDVNLQELVEETVEIVRRHPAHTAGKSIKHESQMPEAVVNVDAEQMKRVFVNLAVNGLEATEPDGTVTVSTYLEDPGSSGNGNRLVFAAVEFTDTGEGIPPENIRRILEPFYSTKGAGTGLGLSIAQRVVERHGGKLSIKSRVGIGTKAKVQIPYSHSNKTEVTSDCRKAA
ncbi:MAG: ATP-binding protein [Candidatus Eisenbacteria bacterium]